MPESQPASPEAVHAAIEALLSRGETPTLMAIRQEVGGGTLGLIYKHLEEWQASRRAGPEAEEGAAPDPAPDQGEAMPTVSAVSSGVVNAIDGLLEAIAEDLRRAETAALAVYADERRCLLEETEATRAEADRVMREADERVASLRDELAGVADENHTLTVEVQTLRAQVEALIAERDTVSADLRKARSELTAWQDKARGEQASGQERIKAEVAAATSRLQAELTMARAEAEAVQAVRGELSEALAEIERARAERDAARELAARADARSQALQSVVDRGRPSRRRFLKRG